MSPGTWRRRCGRCGRCSPRTRRSGSRARPGSRTCCGGEITGRARGPGTAGPLRVPDKHGSPARVCDVVAVLIDDQPGQLARIFADAGRAGVNIEDVRMEHATGQQAGLVQLLVEPAAVPGVTAA